MKVKFAVLLFSASLVAIPLAAHADDSNDLSEALSELILPGQWENTITVNMSVPGTNMKMPARTSTTQQCIKKEDLDDLAEPEMKTMDCDVTRKELSGKTLHLGMTCTNAQSSFTLKGKSTFVTKTSSKMHFVMTGKTHGMDMKIVMDGKSKRVGDCTESEKK